MSVEVRENKYAQKCLECGNETKTVILLTNANLGQGCIALCDKCENELIVKLSKKWGLDLSSLFYVYF